MSRVQLDHGARWLWIGLFILLLLLLPFGLKAQVPQPLGEFPFSLDYVRAYQQMLHTGDLRSIPTHGPFYRPVFDSALTGGLVTPGLRLTGPTDDNIRLYSLIRQRLVAADPGSSDDFFSIGGGFRYQFSSNLSALMLFNLDREKAIDPNYTGKKWRGLAGDIETSALYYTKGNLNLTLGRQRVFWGPRPINLVISSTAEPLDLLSASYRKGRLGFAFLFARLDQSRPNSLDSARFPGQSFNDNRYLVGHRLDITFHRTFRLGLFETTLFGGAGRSPELYYLNPLQLFHTAQLNEDEDDNTMLGFDFQWLPMPRYAVYGQLLVDDFQIDDKTHGDQEPNEIGIMLGLMRAGTPSSITPDLGAEYVRVTNRTYHQRAPRNRYLYRNELIGHPLGPDADSLSVMARFWPTGELYAALELAGSRHGEGSVYKEWDEPWATADGDYSEPFPTGVVQKGLHAGVRVEGYLPFGAYARRHLYLSVRGAFGSYENFRNVDGDDRDVVSVDIGITWLGFTEIGLKE